ncbi:MAG: TAXI family TRAP transporter solute-binding subunit [Lachnospiraceae bacterium]|nr:TAXI family TRAP transporter solute-binding subunit [Lachnospiraceae bacterium]
MRKLLSIVAAAAMVLSLAACGSSGTSQTTAAAAGDAKTEQAAPASSTKMTMGTGGTAGTYYAFGGVLGQYIKNKSGIDVTVVSTDGSKANIQGIDAGDYQLGTVQSDVMAYAWSGTKSFESDGAVNSFRVVAGLYAETVQLITMDPEIKSAADLKGKAVSIGAPGSGVYFNAMDVLAAAGLTESDINPQYLSFADSTEGLKDGKIDAAFIVAGAPTPAITELMTTNDAYLVPIDGEIAGKMMASCPYYTELAIPAGTYPKQDADVTTVTVKATLIVNADASEDDVYALTAAIFDNVSDITAEHAKGAELSIENATAGMTAPFHAGAAKYFQEKGVKVEVQ